MDLEGEGAHGSYFIVPIFLHHKVFPPVSGPFFLLYSLSFFFYIRPSFLVAGIGSRLVHKGYSAGGWACCVCVCCSMKNDAMAPNWRGSRFDVLVHKK